MIQIIPEKRRLNNGQKLGQALGGALSSAAESFAGNLRRNEEDQSIQRETGANLAGIRDPQTRQALMADQLKQGRRYREAEASHNININSPANFGSGRKSFQERLQEPGIYDQEREPEPVIRESQYEEEPRQRPRENKSFGTDKTGQERSQGRTLEPKQATTGEVAQLLSNDQIEPEGKRVARQRTAAGLPTTTEEGIQLVLEDQNRRAIHNQNIENERQTKQKNQRDYGTRAVKSMKKLLKNPTDEHIAYFQRLGEQAAANNENESEFQDEVAKQAKQFKNDISNIENGVKPSRIFNDIQGGFWGNNRTAAERKADMRIAIEPLKKLGFYDTIRKTLSSDKLGYAPEEIESLLSDLSESTTKTLADLPDLSKESNFTDYLPTSIIGKAIGKISPAAGKGLTGLTENIGEFVFPKQFSPENLSLIKNNIKDVFSKDSSTNLLLLRKAYEDKGVDWRTFKNELNTMINNGEIKLNPDQWNQFNSYIMDPPEGPLKYILRKAHFIGR